MIRSKRNWKGRIIQVRYLFHLSVTTLSPCVFDCDSALCCDLGCISCATNRVYHRDSGTRPFSSRLVLSSLLFFPSPLFSFLFLSSPFFSFSFLSSPLPIHPVFIYMIFSLPFTLFSSPFKLFIHSFIYSFYLLILCDLSASFFSPFFPFLFLSLYPFGFTICALVQI